MPGEGGSSEVGGRRTGIGRSKSMTQIETLVVDETIGPASSPSHSDPLPCDRSLPTPIICAVNFPPLDTGQGS